MTTDKIIIDREIESSLPALDDESRKGLERQIKAEGCRDALVVWKQKGILLDGHNRKEICDRLGIGYRTVELEFTDRESALDWIDANALNRRNLTSDQQSLLRGRVYNRKKSAHGGSDRFSANGEKSPGISPSAHYAHLGADKKTANRLAGEFGVSAGTIRRDGEFATAVDELKSIDDEIEKTVVSGNGAPRKRIIQAAKIVKQSPAKAKKILRGESDEKKSEPTDELGKPLPDRDDLRACFEQRSVFEDAMNQFSRIQGAMGKLGEKVLAYLRLAQFKADLKNARDNLRFAKPYAVCPYCKGTAKRHADCNACKGLGWVSEGVFNGAPKELQAAGGKK